LPMPKLFIVYHIFLSKYFATLHQVWIMYHGYIKNIIGHGIFWHYDESFGFSSCHFTYFIRGLSLPLMVQLGAPTFLGCWVMIVPTFITCFQSNDHRILFNVMPHVEIEIFPF
jgi:hypothetical protein